MYKKISHSLAFRFPNLIFKRWLTYLMPFKPVSKPLAQFNYVVLCGAAHFPFLKQVLISIQTQFEQLPNLYVFTDFNTSAQTIKKISALYPADKLHLTTADECVKYHENNGDLLISTYAQKSPMGLKLAAILQITAKMKPVIYTDTDVLWLNDPIPDLTRLSQTNAGLHMSYDYQASYDQRLIEKAGLELLQQEPYYCAGIMFINKLEPEHLDIINDLITIIVEKPDHFSEQTTFAWLQKNSGVSGMTPDKYLLYYDDQSDLKPRFKPGSLARHYVGPVRHLFWRDAFFRNYLK
jgi:hypothetical protein